MYSMQCVDICEYNASDKRVLETIVADGETEVTEGTTPAAVAVPVVLLLLLLPIIMIIIVVIIYVVRHRRRNRQKTNRYSTRHS